MQNLEDFVGTNLSYFVEPCVNHIVQDPNICSSNETQCFTPMRKRDFGCRVSCTGLFADISHIEGVL